MSGSCSLSATIMEEPAIRQGVYVTAFYVLLFYVCIIGQSAAKFKLLKEYRARGERVRCTAGIDSEQCTAVVWIVV